MSDNAITGMNGILVDRRELIATLGERLKKARHGKGCSSRRKECVCGLKPALDMYQAWLDDLGAVAPKVVIVRAFREDGSLSRHPILRIPLVDIYAPSD